jgi:hypothetical protein
MNKKQPREQATNAFMMSHGSVSEEIYGGHDMYEEGLKRNKPTININERGLRNRESGTLGQSGSKVAQHNWTHAEGFTKDIDDEETKVPAAISENIIGGNIEISKRPQTSHGRGRKS